MTAATVTKFPEKSPYMPETVTHMLQSWPQFRANANDPEFLAKMRQNAFEYLTHRGLPTPKLEGWKFTNIIPLVRDFGDVQGKTKVTSNLPDGIKIQPLTESVVEHDWVRKLITEDAYEGDANTDPALWHLCNLYFRDGVSIDVAAGEEIAIPLEILMQCMEKAFYMVHTAIRVGANARVTIIENHRSTEHIWKNRLSHIQLEPGARLTHIRIQEDSAEAVYTQTTRVHVAKDARYDALALYTGARLSRNQVHVSLEAPGAGTHIASASLMRGEQHTDTTVLVEHRAPHCESKQNIRTVLDDRAHGVFQGKVHVHQPAQKTDGFQISRALLLSEGSVMDTKPELEIYADDVKCSHGATTGQLDQEPLFYMQSRGIEENAAKALLVKAFIAETYEPLIDNESIKALLERKVGEWLNP